MNSVEKSLMASHRTRSWISWTELPKAPNSKPDTFVTVTSQLFSTSSQPTSTQISTTPVPLQFCVKCSRQNPFRHGTLVERDVIDEIIFWMDNPRDRLILELMARGGMRRCGGKKGLHSGAGYCWNSLPISHVITGSERLWEKSQITKNQCRRY